MKKKVFRERYRVVESRTYESPYIEGEVITDELLIDNKGKRKVRRTKKTKGDK